MFIISNYKTDIPFKVSKKNNVLMLESNKNNIKYISTEKNSPVNYFCLKRDPNCRLLELNTKDLIEAKMFVVETIFEKESKKEEDEINKKTGYFNLIENFGDKKSKNRLKKIDGNRASSKETAVFNIENQILPKFDKEAEDPKDVYSLELMVEEVTFQKIDEFEIDINYLNDNVRVIYERLEGSNTLNHSNKNIIVALDCYYKILESERININIFEDKGFFIEEIRNELYSGKLPKLSKDKVVVKVYILLLILNNFEMKLDDIPKFGLELSKVLSMLRIVGCTITRGTKVILKEFPKELYTIKKIKV
jgi:hypothetical protein